MSALKAHDWDGMASLYNGAAYKEMAIKWCREPYDITLTKDYLKFNQS